MLIRRLNSFRKDERGVITIELLILVPMLTWALISVIVYFDVFRAQYYSERANETIADIISREENALTPDFLIGADGVLRSMTRIDSTPELRITVVGYTEIDDAYRVIWSRGNDGGVDLDNVNLPITNTNSLPQLLDEEHVIVVRTRVNYSAPIDPGFGFFAGTSLDAQVFERTSIVAPRNIVKVCWDNDPDTDFPPPIC